MKQWECRDCVNGPCFKAHMSFVNYKPEICKYEFVKCDWKLKEVEE